MTLAARCDTCRRALYSGPDGLACLNPRCEASVAVTDDAVARIVIERRRDGHEYVSCWRAEDQPITTFLPLAYRMLNSAADLVPKLIRGMVACMAARN